MTLRAWRLPVQAFAEGNIPAAGTESTLPDRKQELIEFFTGID